MKKTDAKKEPVKTPTREEHDREVRRLWYSCIFMASLVFIGASGTIFALITQGHQWSMIVNIAVTCFDVIILSYGLGFFVPAFLTSLKRMALAIDLSYMGLEVGRQTANLLMEMWKEMKPILDQFGKTTKSVDRLVERLDENLTEDFFERMNDTFDTVTFSKEPLPVAKPLSPSEPRKLPVVDENGKGEGK